MADNRHRGGGDGGGGGGGGDNTDDNHRRSAFLDECICIWKGPGEIRLLLFMSEIFRMTCCHPAKRWHLPKHTCPNHNKVHAPQHPVPPAHMVKSS